MARGATIARGVSDVTVTLGTAPHVRYRVGDVSVDAPARLIIGADGRESMMRGAAGIVLRSTSPTVNMAGMLVAGADAWPSNVFSSGVEGDLWFFIFPQAAGRVRLYAAWGVDDVHRFTGPDRRRLLDTFQLGCLPDPGAISSGHPIGPCATMPMTDTWTDTIAVDGMVLIGDAAGWSDPTIGQGESVTFRDVHIVTDVLVAHRVWTRDVFEPYQQERAEWMRRLRFVSAAANLAAGFGPHAQAKRVRLAQLREQNPTRYGQPHVLLGPWNAPEDTFSDEVLHELRNE